MIAKAISGTRRIFSETRRILRLTRKPRASEFAETSKICGAGILLTGVVGFIIFLAFRLVIDQI